MVLESQKKTPRSHKEKFYLGIKLSTTGVSSYSSVEVKSREIENRPRVYKENWIK